jgi:hypothetical protein
MGEESAAILNFCSVAKKAPKRALERLQDELEITTGAASARLNAAS